MVFCSDRRDRKMMDQYESDHHPIPNAVFVAITHSCHSFVVAVVAAAAIVIHRQMLQRWKEVIENIDRDGPIPYPKTI